MTSKLWRILALGWIGVLFIEPVAEVYDDMTTPQPWFDAQLSMSGDRVLYERQINRWMRGEWVATVQVLDGGAWRGICSGGGSYVYRPETSGRTNMSVRYFTGGCDVPSEPYRICADYVMTDRRGTTRDFGPFCTRE